MELGPSLNIRNLKIVAYLALLMSGLSVYTGPPMVPLAVLCLVHSHQERPEVYASKYFHWFCEWCPGGYFFLD